MSFLDLATLALHRRNEMEERIHVLVSKCDLAISDITRLKTQAQNFVLSLNCEPDQLKERFLRCMRQLDEYIYLVTDFNLSINKLEGTNNVDVTPVQDIKVLVPPLIPNSFNLMDTLSEPAPTTQQSMCLNNCRVEKPFVKKVPKAEQVLIQFSSASTSSESVPQLKNRVAKVNTDMNESCLCHKEVAAANKTAEAETQCQLGTTKMQLLKISTPDDQQSEEEEEAVTLPGQDVLPADRSYPALIMNADSGSFWVITDDIDDTYRLMLEMTTYYKLNTVEMAPEEIIAPCYYAFYDVESDCFYRGLLIRLDEDGTAEVFLVDTGEVRCGDARSCLQPLAPRFTARPPYARFCHLAGVELINLDCEVQLEKFENFMRTYIGLNVTIEVDDNTSESLGVYVVLKDSTILNNLVVQQGLAKDISGKSAATAQSPLPKYIPPEMKLKSEDELDLDITNCPEYDDAEEAVMGYKCRDDAEICKHYKGGPDKTCFKGNHCKKRHVLKHPDGWTLDREEVTGKVPPAVLPPPGAERRALVTCVPHFDHVFLQFLDNSTDEVSLPNFGVVLPPMSLEALVRDMNSPAAVHSYDILTLPPAPGELVAALYCRQWYRARVLSLHRADQTVEVMYIDYGNVSWVREDEVRVLHRRYTALPVCAARAALAGVVPKPGAAATDPAHTAKATAHLAALALDKWLDVVVVGRDYDEIAVVLYDEKGYNIAEHMEAMNLLKLEPYTIMDDNNVPQKHVVP